MQAKSGVGWKRTSKYDVVSADFFTATGTEPDAEPDAEPDTEPLSTALTVGVGKTDILMRAIESAGMSYAVEGTGFNEITRSAPSNIARSNTTSGCSLRKDSSAGDTI